MLKEGPRQSEYLGKMRVGECKAWGVLRKRGNLKKTTLRVFKKFSKRTPEGKGFKHIPKPISTGHEGWGGATGRKMRKDQESGI